LLRQYANAQKKCKLFLQVAADQEDATKVTYVTSGVDSPQMPWTFHCGAGLTTGRVRRQHQMRLRP
jgi:hypothetical protein